MDIRFFTRRHHELAAQSSKSAASTEAPQTADANQTAQAATQAAQPAAASGSEAAAPTTDTAERPAAISRFTPAGRLLNALQSFEDRHPEQTKEILGNIADKLRSDAERAGPFSDRLNKWADRFQAAADSGDMSQLMPRVPSHFGMRAYQQADQSDNDATVEHVADTAESHAAATRPAARSGEKTTAPAESTASEAAASSTVAVEARTQPVTVPESTKADADSDIRDRPVTVPESATAQKTAASDIRHRPVTVPDSSKMSDTR
ncbi:MAG TPA: hypothetical protein VFN67_10455 [Polyangiales bacterium]|nr:hypothetical protein [Polyangiales bacterium]